MNKQNKNTNTNETIKKDVELAADGMPCVKHDIADFAKASKAYTRKDCEKLMEAIAPITDEYFPQFLAAAKKGTDEFIKYYVDVHTKFRIVPVNVKNRESQRIFRLFALHYICYRLRLDSEFGVAYPTCVAVEWAGEGVLENIEEFDPCLTGLFHALNFYVENRIING